MRIPDYASIKQSVQQRLEAAPISKQLVLIFALCSAGAAAFITGIQFVLDLQIEKTSGLGSLGVRSLLSSLSQFLPVVQMLFLLVLEFGYLASMVRISRGQYTSTKTMKTGVDRLWPLLRMNILKSLVLMGVTMGSFYVAMGIFLISPFSNKLISLVEPIASQMVSGSMMLEETVQNAILRATVPAFLIWGVVLLVLVVPVLYRYRMTDYVLYDNPSFGARVILRESKRMMQHNGLALFRLDLHFWWYYLAMGLVMVLAYGDLILGMMGISLPLSENVSYFLFYFLSLACQTVVLYLFRNRVEVTYAMAYDAIRPKQEQSGVVLGNIFQM